MVCLPQDSSGRFHPRVCLGCHRHQGASLGGSPPDRECRMATSVDVHAEVGIDGNGAGAVVGAGVCEDYVMIALEMG